MAIKRDNILGLIGRGRYHSAILTTFSFDFYFFEMKAMKWLRSCGVRNVNVLIDGHYYASLMQQGSGQEMQLTPGYSLYPIFQSSTFHPKIWMLFGDKEGLLIIGSGNLTNGGNGSNEEIWGAFHFDIQATENAPIFSAVWSYLQQLCSGLKGIVYEKTNRWILDHAKWVNGLTTVNAPGSFFDMGGPESIAFLYNSEDQTIWQQLVNLLSQEKVVEITTISPFYDRNGKAIQALKGLFPEAKINIVIDDSGLIPDSLPLSDSYYFYNWYEVGISKKMIAKVEDFSSHSKLHAKIIHFSTNSRKEYCLFGSANVTPEGLGLTGVKSNSEAGVLMKAEDGGILNELGIKLRSPKTLSSFAISNSPSIFEAVIKGNMHVVKLVSAEWFQDVLYLFTEGKFEHALTIKLFDSEGRIKYGQKINVLEPELKIKPDNGSRHFHSVQLFHELTNEPISNRLLISDYYLLARTNPNATSAEIDRIINEIHEEGFEKILDLLHYAILDDTEDHLFSKSSTLSAKQYEIGGADKLYDLSSYKVQDSAFDEKHLLITSSTLRVLDVIKLLNSKNFGPLNQQELSADEQEADLGAIKGVDAHEKPMQQYASFIALKSERNKLNNYFKKLNKHQEELLYSIHNAREYRLSFSDLTKYLIAIELMLEFGGKTEKYIDNNQAQVFQYLEYNDLPPYEHFSVKTCSLELIGNFLRLAQNGFKEYSFEYTKVKMVEFKEDALVSSIVCLLNNKWRESEMPYLNTLLLNCLHYLGKKTPFDFQNELHSLMHKINAKEEQLKRPSSALSENLNWLTQRIIPAFKRAITQLEAKQFDTFASNNGSYRFEAR